MTGEDTMYRFEKDKSLVDKLLDIIRDNGFSIRVNKNNLIVSDCTVGGRCSNCLFDDTCETVGDCSLGWLQWLLEEVEEETSDKYKDCVYDEPINVLTRQSVAIKA